MKRFAFIAILAVGGCGKKSDPPAAVAVEETSTEASVTAVPAGPPPNFSEQLHGTVHPEMTMRLQMFRQLKGRLPENFYELQNMPGFDGVPGLPLNMKYEIDPKDKTVKVVKK